MKYLVFVTALIALPFQGWATTVAKVSAADLFDHAEFVGIVEVVKGYTIQDGGYSCGAIYTARVEHRFKGEVSEQIQFGHYHGYQIGSRYLLFLTEPGEEFQRLMSTNSTAMAAEAEAEAKCASVQTGHGIMHQGFGSLTISWASEFGYNNAVQVPSAYVEFPEDLERVSADLGEAHRFSEMVLIREADVIRYLRTLQ